MRIAFGLILLAVLPFAALSGLDSIYGREARSDRETLAFIANIDAIRQIEDRHGVEVGLGDARGERWIFTREVYFIVSGPDPRALAGAASELADLDARFRVGVEVTGPPSAEPSGRAVDEPPRRG